MRPDAPCRGARGAKIRLSAAQNAVPSGQVDWNGRCARVGTNRPTTSPLAREAPREDDGRDGGRLRLDDARRIGPIEHDAASRRVADRKPPAAHVAADRAGWPAYRAGDGAAGVARDARQLGQRRGASRSRPRTSGRNSVRRRPPPATTRIACAARSQRRSLRVPSCARRSSRASGPRPGPCERASAAAGRVWRGAARGRRFRTLDVEVVILNGITSINSPRARRHLHPRGASPKARPKSAFQFVPENLRAHKKERP